MLGICTLLEMGPQRPNIEEVVPKLLPSCLVLFDGLKRAYEARAEGDDDDSSDDDDDEDDDGMLRTIPYPCVKQCLFSAQLKSFFSLISPY